MRDFKVTMLLADAAQHVQGKFYVLGGGWSVINAGPVMFAVVAYVQTAWHRANMKNRFRLELLDADGAPVTVTMPDGNEHPVLLEGEFEVGRPPGLKAGTPIDGGIVWNVGVPLPADQRLEIRLTLNDETHEEWTLPFTTPDGGCAGGLAHQAQMPRPPTRLRRSARLGARDLYRGCGPFVVCANGREGDARNARDPYLHHRPIFPPFAHRSNWTKVWSGSVSGSCSSDALHTVCEHERLDRSRHRASRLS